ncbi:MAG TPA: nuclear transport factor 2 family protein [Solirubrobacteraceae bacterium]|jgi:ketosteroid isomerase-like protein|nr:nuclear transport factor 2 family protein [Solirubrobacteraceae bacterium]
MTARHQPLDDLDRRWTEAEVGGDTATLDGLATDDFTLVGPAGFVLSKQQWLDRYRDGDLRMQALRFEGAATRVYGDTALTIGRQIQEADYHDRPVNGEFRVTRVAVRDDSGWRLAGLHLSPIAGPPAGARRPAQ